MTSLVRPEQRDVPRPMPTSRIGVFHGPGQPIRLQEVTVPPLREGELLVRNEYATLCRSDLNTFAGKRTEPSPTILGHEIVGRLEAFGPGAPRLDSRGATLAIGDRVTWAIYAASPDSTMARLGMPQKGPDLFKYGHERLTADHTLHGGLADYCVLRRHTPLVRLSGTVPLPVLALVNCAIATVAGSLRLAGTIAGRTVLVAGAGMLGVTACAMTRVAGAQRVVAVDVAGERLAVATRFGADLSINLAEGQGTLAERLAACLSDDPVSVALDYSGVPDTMEAILGALGVGGVAVFVGATFPQRALRVNAEQLVRNLHTVRGLHNYNERDLVTAVEFMERHHATFPFASLVHDQFGLHEVNEAFAHALASGAYRVGIRLA